MTKKSKKRKVNFYSKEFFNSEKKKSKSEQKVLEATRTEISKYYEQQLSFDFLLKQYRYLEFLEKHDYNILSALGTGAVSSLFSAVFFAVITKYIDNTLLTIISLIFGVILMIPYFAFCYGLIRSALLSASPGSYEMIIIPFEKKIIIDKLQKDFNFDFNGAHNEKEKDSALV